MKVTFPQLGNTCFAAKAIFDDIGIEYILPPVSNKTCLEIGSKISPEEMCFPFKIMMGAYIQSIEKGADTIILPGSCGPCRYGEYCELQMNILRKLGYNIKFIVIDTPGSIGKDELLNRIAEVGKSSEKSRKQKMLAVLNGYKIIRLMDDIERKTRMLSGYEMNRGECKRILRECKKEALNTFGSKEMIKVLMRYKEKLSSVKVNMCKKPVKIAIIGEIYTILEPFSNQYIEDKLMDMGISTQKTLTPSWWVKNTVLSPFKLNSIDIRRASKKYLPLYIGGHSRECVGEAVLAHKNGFDGAIQILPMGCMPEIVSKSILPTISSDRNFPIMTLVVDEMTGDAGFDTRVEAFADLLERRRMKNVLYGY
ncbi:putative nucleotide-binding protein (sugar kinase/HSP70/actin superfamily) [Clostridium pascui]|uniref:acyl-CoA dehydratase activase-related protein n=1 Tax=Clostridium pascui TaxID=46609 RepID=UPI00195C9260|nr:acyl-CoA dehydratase activase-related protein [Clostridium pascui]MBM7870367.1 putative nucleotide-binding protein (sugar kinase/HSP70/actin superfamily) [Clostridium pascui]